MGSTTGQDPGFYWQEGINTRNPTVKTRFNTKVLFIIGLACGSTSTFANPAPLPPFDCLIEPELVADVGSPVDGVIEKFFVNKSDIVKKGQKLAQLNQSVNLSTAILAKAQSEMQEKIKSKQAYLDFAQRKLNRIQQLYKQKAASNFQKDEAETELKLARSELALAKREKLLAKLEYQQSMQRLMERSIRSPFDGIVVKRHLALGESVKDKPIMKLAKINPLRVELILTAEMFGLIKKGMVADIIPELPHYKPAQATVTVVDKLIDAASGTFGVRLALPNPDYTIPSGLRCQAQFLSKEDMSLKSKTK